MSKKTKTIDEILTEVLIPDEGQPYNLPNNWNWVYSGYVMDFIGGGTPSKSNTNYWNGDIPWSTVKDIKQTYISSTIDYITSEGLKNSSASMALENELLLITRMSPGKCTITKISTAINQDLKIVRPKIEIPTYLLWIFFTFNTPLIESMSTGSTVKGIQVAKLKTIPFPLPPIHEQKRIAEKVERLLSKVNEAKQLIEEAKETLELRRAAILDMSFRGELTKKWREENPNVMDAETLYCKIKESQIGKRKKVKDITNNELRYELPHNWKWVRLGDVFNITSGGTPKRSEPSYYEGDIPWIKTGEVKWNYIYDSEEKINSDAIANSSAKLLPINTVLVAMYGQGLTRGRASILNIEAACNQAVCALLPNENVLSEFLFYYFMEGYQRFRQIAKGGNQENFSATMISEFLLPLPPFEEQKAIVHILEGIFNREEEAESIINLKDMVDELKQCILLKAYRGELGTNDPSEESAIELLKEVLEEQMK
ncbi:restriction endonuclease subunit S [Sporosarcina highlanderae]|uniref:Restriction endonuclease subunit S n=1 Tax=Sporosarcina highlanderae TaxID=3035916 RepID=A0ABT8JS36_9BACL|nr:restriction endonuclease subunit S [Sporosarcina highlanderae]MDN4607351.1 restriction endonuclease subunit S [Sporosarcina highlanderae]